MVDRMVVLMKRYIQSNDALFKKACMLLCVLAYVEERRKVSGWVGGGEVDSRGGRVGWV